MVGIISVILHKYNLSKKFISPEFLIPFMTEHDTGEQAKAARAKHTHTNTRSDVPALASFVFHLSVKEIRDDIMEDK